MDMILTNKKLFIGILTPITADPTRFWTRGHSFQCLTNFHNVAEAQIPRQPNTAMEFSQRGHQKVIKVGIITEFFTVDRDTRLQNLEISFGIGFDVDTIGENEYFCRRG